MKTAQVILEKSDNNYSAYVAELSGCIATGGTLQETKENIEKAVAFHLEGLKEEGLEIPDIFNDEYELVFKLDIESFFEWFSGILTKAALARLTGLNESLISQYANGLKKPSVKQNNKIVNAIHNFGEELLQIQL
jgi:predicted RNase H-like HicB family nuclease